MRRILGRWQNMKHWENLSPPRQQLHWQNLSDVTILDIVSRLKACNFQRKAWSENYSSPSLTLQSAWQTAVHRVLGASCRYFAGASVDKNDSVLKIWWVCALIGDCYSNHNGRIKEMDIFFSPAYFVASPSPSCPSDFQGT